MKTALLSILLILNICRATPPPGCNTNLTISIESFTNLYVQGCAATNCNFTDYPSSVFLYSDIKLIEMGTQKWKVERVYRTNITSEIVLKEVK